MLMDGDTLLLELHEIDADHDHGWPPTARSATA